jgi:hypothetical protein
VEGKAYVFYFGVADYVNTSVAIFHPSLYFVLIESGYRHSLSVRKVTKDTRERSKNYINKTHQIATKLMCKNNSSGTKLIAT